MTIRVSANGSTAVFELNDSAAAKALLAQLPLNIKSEPYGGNEVIFYPPRKLDTANTPLAKGGKPGTLAYYAPWGDVVMFYESFSPASGLYELGHAISGGSSIRDMNGNVQVSEHNGEQ